jgi:hypothetical protein
MLVASGCGGATVHESPTLPADAADLVDGGVDGGPRCNRVQGDAPSYDLFPEASFGDGCSAIGGRSVAFSAAAASELARQCSRPSPCYEEAFDLGPSDLRAVECRLPNLERAVRAFSRDFSVGEFDRQYVGMIANGRRFVYINGLSRSDFFDDSRPIVVCDGGTMFWGAQFDIESATFSEFYFNESLL